MERVGRAIWEFEGIWTNMQTQENVFASTRSLFKALPALRSYTATVQSVLPDTMYFSSAAKHITAILWRRRLFTRGSAAANKKLGNTKT